MHAHMCLYLSPCTYLWQTMRMCVADVRASGSCLDVHSSPRAAHTHHEVPVLCGGCAWPGHQHSLNPPSEALHCLRMVFARCGLMVLLPACIHSCLEAC